MTSQGQTAIFIHQFYGFGLKHNSTYIYIHKSSVNKDLETYKIMTLQGQTAVLIYHVFGPIRNITVPIYAFTNHLQIRACY